MLKRGAVLAALVLALALSFRPIERPNPPQVGGVAVMVTCYADDFMSAENSSMIDEALRFSPHLMFAPGICPLAAPIEIAADDDRDLTITGGHFAFAYDAPITVTALR